jgi:hypothetical protein
MDGIKNNNNNPMMKAEFNEILNYDLILNNIYLQNYISRLKDILDRVTDSDLSG